MRRTTSSFHIRSLEPWPAPERGGIGPVVAIGEEWGADFHGGDILHKRLLVDLNQQLL